MGDSSTHLYPPTHFPSLCVSIAHRPTHPPTPHRGYALQSIHREVNPLAAIKQAQAIYICGGNVFRLLKQLRKHGLLEPLRERILQDGVPYLGTSFFLSPNHPFLIPPVSSTHSHLLHTIGVSAGTVVACPTICTSNDMPIVDPADGASSSSSLAALGLVDFQINAHFYGGDFYSQEPGTGQFQVHFGMNREERIKEYHEENDLPVLGLAEGYILKCTGPHISLLGGASTRGAPLTIFRPHHFPLEIEGLGGEDLAPLIHPPTSSLVPLSILFGNPVKTQCRLSPDGRFLSYLAPDPKTDVLNVWYVHPPTYPPTQPPLVRLLSYPLIPLIPPTHPPTQPPTHLPNTGWSKDTTGWIQPKREWSPATPKEASASISGRKTVGICSTCRM